MEKEEIRERIKERGEPLGKTERKLIDYLIEEGGRKVKLEEIVKEVYKIEADENSKNSIRMMIYRINYKIRRTGIKIISKRQGGYYIDEKKEYIKRGKIVNHYKEIERISEEELERIIRNLRKGR